MSASSYFPHLSPTLYSQDPQQNSVIYQLTRMPVTLQATVTWPVHMIPLKELWKKISKTFKFHFAAFDNISFSFFLDPLVH